MEIYAVVRPDETQELLARLRQIIDDHTDRLIVWVSLVVGRWLIGKIISLLVT